MPKYFRAYKKVCDEEGLILGGLHSWKKDQIYSSIPASYIFSLPTKNHWREVSYIEPIAQSLKKLWAECTTLDLRSVVIPALGCGLGGLEWDLVRNVIITSATDYPFRYNLDIILIPPKNYE
jgi:O-acetyl-ADP-ribose deacetylase (regulator of RNase III)